MARWLRVTALFFAFLLAWVPFAWAQGEVGGFLTPTKEGLKGWVVYGLTIIIMLELIWLLTLEIQQRHRRK